MTVDPLRAVLLNDTRVDRHHGCRAVIDAVHALAGEQGIRIIAAAPAHRDWRDDPAICDAIDRADLVIVNAEGTIHHDRPAGAALLAAGDHARRRGKPAALINATWQENGPQFADQARAFSLVSARESASAAEFASIGIPARIVADLALHRHVAQTAARGGIAYTDSVVGSGALALHRRMSALGAAPISILHGRRRPRHIASSLRRYGLGAGLPWPRRIALAMRAALADLRAQTGDPARFEADIARRALVVTGRFHAMIFCMAAATPFLVVASNTHKNAATLADSGLEPWRHVAIEAIDEALLERAAQWHGEEAGRLAAFLARSRAEMRALFRDIRGLAA